MSSVHTALKWSFLGEIASKAVTPVVFVVLARLLTPEDYGVVAAATMVISFSQIFWEAGMGRAVIQYRGDRAVAASTAFWLNNVLGLVVAVVLVAGSGLIADRIFHDPRVALVLQIMALQVLLSAAVSIHIALLQKDLNFRHLFWVRLATVAIPGLASIPLAMYGMGYWALVAGALAGQVFQVALFWKTSPWRPRFIFDQRVARELVKFGGWVAVTALLAWFYLWADSLIVGIYLGPHELGLYRTGNAFIVMIYGLLFSPLMPVLYSHLSAVSPDRDRIQEIMSNVVRMLTFLSIPLAAIIAANADFIGGLVFGPEWTGISLVIAVMALTQGISWIISANGEAYRAIGTPSIETKAMGLSLGIYLIGYLASIQHGFEAFLWTRFGLVFVGAVIQLWFLRKSIGIEIKKVIGYSLVTALVCSIPILVATLVMREWDVVSKMGLFVFTSVSIACLLFLYERNRLIPQLWHDSKKMFSK